MVSRKRKIENGKARNKEAAGDRTCRNRGTCRRDHADLSVAWLAGHYRNRTGQAGGHLRRADTYEPVRCDARTDGASPARERQRLLPLRKWFEVQEVLHAEGTGMKQPTSHNPLFRGATPRLSCCPVDAYHIPFQLCYASQFIYERY